MPQTSPMVWLIMSTTIPLLLTSFFSHFSFTTNLNSITPNYSHIKKKFFNWMW